MTFRQFAFNNVTRNKRLYAAYFLSSMFTVMVFFTFAIFAFHPALTGPEMNKHVTSGLTVAAGIIYVFSFFFVLYSMGSFIQSRKREFGILMIQRMSTRQIRSMVFLENMLIGFFATLGGIALGLVFSKVILLIAENVLVIGTDLNFYLPLKAILATFASFILLFLVISFSVSFLLRSRKLINLIKGNKRSKGEPKASIFLTIVAILLLGCGYITALLAIGMAVTVVMVPVVIVVIIGTYLLFTQLNVYVIRKLKNKEAIFWKKTNMVLFSDLSFRMKDNARTFFMVAIISTVSFCAIGSLFGFQSLITGGLKDTNPYSITYTSFAGSTSKEADIALIEEELSKKKVKTKKANMTLSYFDLSDREVPTLIVKQSDYNHLTELLNTDSIQLENGQALVVGYMLFNNRLAEEMMNEPIELKSGAAKPIEKNESASIPGNLAYYVVTDEDFTQLKEPIEKEDLFIWNAKGAQQELVQVGKILAKNLKKYTEDYQYTSVDYEVYEINKQYGPILFVGLFIGIVFFVSSGSFLYFRLYTDLDEDKQKFQSIAKMGLTEGELKKVLNRQTALLFFAPIVIALIHGAVALTALSNMFQYNLFNESAIVLSIFFLIQVVYFFIVRFFYTKQIRAVI
ncbi:ABC transporter permease [Metabacillus bambusae]|uniref:ABC transporter permease n=1 Tax=Metabacillus bambusae TaxID=2795218 RepID=A0ABS3N5Z5_9BACI|nr:ABC transporter permease [Metabacillus bambusae]MBO1513672.1 ABC transporter permease [Metabacillus bambusae]